MNFKRSILLSISALLLAVSHLGAQNVTDLIISEAATDGDEAGIIDGFGERHGWIELFNNSQGTVNYGGCFLSNDRNHLQKTVISKSDMRTKLGPRQAVLFHASGDGSKGTFYVDFKVKAGETLYLTSNDGRTIIDSLQIPSHLPVGKSICKIALDEKQMEWNPLLNFSDPTPGTPNGIGSEESNSQKMARQDPYGVILSIVSVSVVFASLIILWILFSTLFSEKKKKKETKPAPKAKAGEMTDEVAAAISMALDEELNGETYAAIGMALHQYLNETVHDQESFVITIRPSAHSDWTDKTQGFRRRPGNR